MVRLEIDTPEIEAGEWAAIDGLIGASRPSPHDDGEGGRPVGGIYAVGGFADGRFLMESPTRLLLGKEAFVLQEPATGAAIQTVPYAAIHACALSRKDPADDFLVVAPGLAAIVRQAGAEVRQRVESDPDLAAFKAKLSAPTTAVVEELTGVPGRLDGLPTALRLKAGALRADWGRATAVFPLAQMTRRRWERLAPPETGEPEAVRLIVEGRGQEWVALGPAAQLLPLIQALDEAALPGELERETLSALYARWQRRRPEPLVWGLLSDIGWLNLRLRRLAETAETRGSGRAAATNAACDLLADHRENVKAKLALLDLYLPYWAAADEEAFLQQLGDATESVRDRSCRYVEAAVQAIIGAPLAHLHGALAPIERSLTARDELRQMPRPGKLTLGFDSSYCATVATALGASVLGPLGAVAGVALSGLQLNQEKHSKDELQASLIEEYETNVLEWWQHLTDRLLPLLVRQVVRECERVSRSLAPRDRQVYERLTAEEEESGERRFRQALIHMLRAHARFRWSRIEVGAGETLTAGELLDALLATPLPLPSLHALFPMGQGPLSELGEGPALPEVEATP